MAEYTPSEARVCIDYCNAVVARRFSMCDPGVGMARADAEFDRFIEKVKRDAAREAWDECADEGFDLGWLHGPGCTNLTNRNPYREETTP